MSWSCSTASFFVSPVSGWGGNKTPQTFPQSSLLYLACHHHRYIIYPESVRPADFTVFLHLDVPPSPQCKPTHPVKTVLWPTRKPAVNINLQEFTDNQASINRSCLWERFLLLVFQKYSHRCLWGKCASMMFSLQFHCWPLEPSGSTGCHIVQLVLQSWNVNMPKGVFMTWCANVGCGWDDFVSDHVLFEAQHLIYAYNYFLSALCPSLCAWFGPFLVPSTSLLLLLKAGILAKCWAVNWNYC